MGLRVSTSSSTVEVFGSGVRGELGGVEGGRRNEKDEKKWGDVRFFLVFFFFWWGGEGAHTPGIVHSNMRLCTSRERWSCNILQSATKIRSPLGASRRAGTAAAAAAPFQTGDTRIANGLQSWRGGLPFLFFRFLETGNRRKKQKTEKGLKL